MPTGRTRAVSATSCPAQPRSHAPAGSRTPCGGDGGQDAHGTAGTRGHCPLTPPLQPPVLSATQVSLFLPEAPRSPEGPAAWSPRRQTGRCQSCRDWRGVSHAEEWEAGAWAELGVPRTPAPAHPGNVTSAFSGSLCRAWPPRWDRWDWEDAACPSRPPGLRFLPEKQSRGSRRPCSFAYSRHSSRFLLPTRRFARRRAHRSSEECRPSSPGVSGVGEVDQAERRRMQ